MLKKKNKLIVGIVGLGVGFFHLKNSSKYRNCKVKYICDHNKKKLNKLKNEFNIQHATSNYMDIINDNEVNTIIIASNDNDHFPQIISSLENDKNVFVEKPMCLTLSELKKIIKLKNKKPKLILASNLVLRTHPFFEKLIKKKITFKKIYYLEGDYNYGRLEKFTKGWRGKIKNYSVILGGGIHLLDLILKIKGKKVKKIFSLGNKIITAKQKKIPNDFAVSLIKFDDGSIAKLASNFSSATDHHHIFNIYSENTSLFYSRDKSAQFFREQDDKNKIIIKYKHINDTKAKMLRNFYKSIEFGKNNLVISEKELFYLMKICLFLVESQKKNKIFNL